MNSDTTRQTVSKAYTEALDRATKGASSCCAPSCCAPDGAQAPDVGAQAPAVASLVAGYGAEADAHPEAAATSFGCGNPLAFAEVAAGETVVDLGSGAGFDLLIAADKVGPSGRVIGVDMTDAMIDRARANAATAGATQVEVRKGIIEDLPVRDASADWVISTCVINLSPEKPKVFGEIARVLKPGGRIRISDIVAQDLPDWIKGHAAAYAACVAGAISEEDYVQGLRDAGLEDVQVTERFVYDADMLTGMVANDLANLGLDEATLAAGVAQVEGKVWSARFEARLPE